MKKYYLLLAAGALGCALASLPVLASDAPTDEGNYIWQDENGDFWWRNGSEDEYLGDGNIIMRTAASGGKMATNRHTSAHGISITLMITEICRNFPVPHRMEMTATRSPLIPIVSLTIRSSARASST